MRKTNMNRIVILNVIGTFSYQAINFLLTPILTRALGEYDYGLISLYTSWVNILLPILSLTINSAVSLIKIYIDEKEQPAYYTSLVGMSTAFFALVSLLMLIFIKPISTFMQFEPIILIFMLMQCFGMMLVNFIVAYYVQFQRPVLQFCFTISLSVVTCFSTIFLLRYISAPEQKYLARILGYSIPYFVAGLIVICILLRISRNWFCIKAWKYSLPICVPLIFHSLSHIILNKSSAIVLQNFFEDGVEKAGYYSFAYTIATIMQVLWTAFNNAWVPYYFKLLKDNDNDGVMQSSKRYLILFTGAFAAFTLVSPEATLVMGGEKYANAGPLVIMLLIGIYMIYLYSFAVNYKTYKKRSISIAVGTIAASAINLGISFMVVPKFGYWGSAAAMVISYTALLVIHQLTVKDKKTDGESSQYNYSSMFFISGLAVALVSCALAYVFIDKMLLRWALAAIIGILLVVRLYKQKRIF